MMPHVLLSAFLVPLLPVQGVIPDIAHPRFIVSTDWVADHLRDPDLVLLQVGTREQYDSTHIPGALFVSRDDISLPETEGGIVLQLPPVSRLDSVFESKGITDSSLIVLYWGRDWISPTARVYLTLDYLGLGERTVIMDGGMQAWITEGKPVTDAEAPVNRGDISPAPRNDVVVDLEWVEENLDNRDIMLVDSRNTPFYTGEKMGNASRPGHIPGARNIPFSDLVDESNHFKSQDELRAMFAEQGMNEGRTAVSYCHIGQQASLTYFVARYLGYNARMYDGSMNEWTRHSELPVVTEEQK